MNNRKITGQKSLFLISLVLILVSLWEASVRLDAMYKPLMMFFSMAFGENIPLTAVMSYFDWSIFEAPVWLLGCASVGILSLFLIRRSGGRVILLVLSLGLSVYGFARESTVWTDIWKLIQPALLIAVGALSAYNLFIEPLRRRRSVRVPYKAVSDEHPHMTDAPCFHRNDPEPEKETEELQQSESA